MKSLRQVLGRQPYRTHISKKEAVSEQDAHHPTIETGGCAQSVSCIRIMRMAGRLSAFCFAILLFAAFHRVKNRSTACHFPDSVVS